MKVSLTTWGSSIGFNVEGPIVSVRVKEFDKSGCEGGTVVDFDCQGRDGGKFCFGNITFTTNELKAIVGDLVRNQLQTLADSLSTK